MNRKRSGGERGGGGEASGQPSEMRERESEKTLHPALSPSPSPRRDFLFLFLILNKKKGTI